MPGSFIPTESLFSAAPQGVAKQASGAATGSLLGLAGQLSPVADIGSFALGLSEALAPDKGFSFNLCAFSLSFTGTSGTAAASGALAVTQGPVFFRVLKGSPGESQGVHPVVELGIRQITGGGTTVGIVEPRQLQGFDTSIGNNLAVEVVAQSLVPVGVLLIVKGWINPVGKGFAHFVGAAAVSVSGDGSLRVEPKFMTQAPPRGPGVGIAGHVIETYASGPALTIRMYQASPGD